MSTYRYRLPGDTKIHYGTGYETEGFGPAGFAFAPFADGKPLTINCENEEIRILDCNKPVTPNKEQTPSPFGIPDRIYTDNVARISAYHRQNGGKTVYSRRKILPMAIDSLATFLNLCRAYPAAFVFLFKSETYGSWIGASPELLLRKTRDNIHTMALAGTRPAHTPEPWDKKNLEEQGMVTRYIYDTFRRFGLEPVVGELHTRNAGPVEHLCTCISARVAPRFPMEEFLASYSPTPALCGSDKKISLRFIKETETSPRRLYGGWCGPVGQYGFSLFVNLRSAAISPDSIATLYVGGGITGKSVPEEEWLETERKSETLMKYIVFR